MSLVYILEHDENVQDIEKRLERKVHFDADYEFRNTKKKVRRIVSKPNLTRGSDGKVWLNSSPKFAHKTMGLAREPKENAPCNFLRKHAGIKWQRQNDHKCPKGAKMPPVPRFERQEKADKECENFIKRNIELIKCKVAKKPTPRYVDTPKGHRLDLINSGILPQHICSSQFGRVPSYLQLHKKRLEELRQLCEPEELKKEQKCMELANAGLRVMTDEERKTIMAGLKVNFTELTRIYQSMPLITDTAAKLARRGEVEKKLFELESDMKLIDCHEVIYISDI